MAKLNVTDWLIGQHTNPSPKQYKTLGEGIDEAQRILGEPAGDIMTTLWPKRAVDMLPGYKRTFLVSNDLLAPSAKLIEVHMFVHPNGAPSHYTIGEVTL